MRCNSFLRSVIYAALASLGYVPYATLVSPLLGPEGSLGLYLVGVTALYLAGLAPRRRFGMALGGGLLGLGAFVLAGSTGALIVALAAFLGLVRSGFLYRAQPARAALLEGLLLGGGLLFGRFLVDPSAPGIALAIWGFFLVQSLFFLVGGIRARSEPETRLDPFEEARSRALSLLEDPSR